jgi:hypothetical protein
MRPKDWRKALKRQLDEIASLRADAATAYRRINEQCDDNEQIARQQLEFVERVTAEGKYNRQIAQALLSSYCHVLRPNNPAEGSVRSEDCPLRKSRAKIHVTRNTVMDIMRGVSPLIPSANVDPTNVAHTTLDSPLGFEQPAPTDPYSDDNTPDQKNPRFGSFDSGEVALEAERQEHAERIARQNAFVSFEADAAEGVEKTGESRICYDFSDPCDVARFPPELASLYPKFEKTCSLPVLLAIEDMPEDDYKTWMKVVRFSDLPEAEQDKWVEINMRPYRDTRSYIKASGWRVREQILLEYDRRVIWPWVRLRLEFVDMLMLNRESTSCGEDGLDSLAKFDYMVEGQVTPEQRRQYAQVIDLLQWPTATSRRELILRANPAYELDLLYDYKSLLDYSSDAGPAKNIPAWRRMREPRPASVNDALMRLYERSDGSVIGLTTALEADPSW